MIMRKISILGLFAAGAMLFANCGGGAQSVTKGRQEITIPCQDQGRSDKNFFRASATAKSANLNTAKQKALLNAKQTLAAGIASTIKSVTENYVNEMDAAGASEFEQSYQNMTKEVVNQKLSSVTVTCEKYYEAEGGGYEAFVAVEMSKEDILNAAENSISKDKKLEVMYDREKFRQKFDEEMSKL